LTKYYAQWWCKWVKSYRKRK